MTATDGVNPGRGVDPGDGADRTDGSTAAIRLLWMATLFLPRGASRDRYRREFAAELYGQPPVRQLSYAISVCAHLWSLRAVVVHGSDLTLVPFLCRMNLHHRWKKQATEDGVAFQTCSRCGRGKDNSTEDSINALFLPIGAGSPKP